MDFVICFSVILIAYTFAVFYVMYYNIEKIKKNIDSFYNKTDSDIYDMNTFLDQMFIDPVDIYMEPIDTQKFYKIPEQGSKFAAGFDIYWSTVNKDLNEDGSITIDPGETLIFGTNLKIAISLEDYYLDVCSRSGLSINRGLIVINSPARIDSDYRGELLVGIHNCSKEPQTIEANSRIAQCTLHRLINTNFLLGKVINNTDRGDGGLGHSGNTEVKK